MLQSTFARVARFATSVLRVRALDKLAADDARRVRWGWVVALAVLGVLLASGSARAQGHGGGCHVAPGCTPTGNPCTVAVCVDDDLGGSHCMTHPVTGVSCDDGVFCNGTDTCDSTGSCSVHKGDPCPGADGDGNCAESCNEAGNSCTGPDPAGSACDDGNVCDGTDKCDGAGHCVNQGPPVAGGTVCSDGLFCNGTDTCDSAGHCSNHAGNPCPGPDGDGNCAESCNEATDSCTAPDPPGSACNDGIFCDGADTCDSSGHCSVHAGDPCPGPDGDADCSESCNEGSASCTGNDPPGSACDDGHYCNGADTCDSSGRCAVHTGIDPCAGANGGACADQCNDATGGCDLPDPAGTACADDGNPCTTDLCSGPVNTAYVGFTASTASPLDSTHEILSWQVAGTAINFADFGSNHGLVFDGAAFNDDGTLRLTTDGNNDQVGATWWDQKIPVESGLDVTFTFRITGVGAPADGFAFVIQDSPQGTAAIATDPAGSLGYEGIPNSLAIEFDTFQNANDGPVPHISIRSLGTLPNSPDAGGHGSTTWSAMADGQIHTVHITYTPGSLKIYIDGDPTPYLTSAFDLASLNLGVGACNHAAGHAGAVCRASAGECDVAESCDGTDPNCPDDAKVEGGTACTPDDKLCTLDVCDGSSTDCQHPAGNGGTLCRASAGECDVAEVCTGVDTDCPFDAKVDGGTACTDDGSICTLDVCDGGSADCQHPAGNAGTLCRASTGECDPAESCDGATPACPADAKSSPGTACTSDGNPCTLDLCDGANGACQHPAGNAGVTCRAASGVCDVAEVCDGTSPACPANQLASASTVCRAAAGPCDVAETCTGTSSTCPTNALVPAGAVCRAASDDCDVVETCNGTLPSCPADAVANPSTVCRPASDACDVAETCNGVSKACPSDGVASPDTVCRPASDVCDVAETCSGVSKACPNDGLAGPDTVCRAASGACDVAETCSGSSKACPDDAFASATTVCRPSLGECDPSELCTGSAAACPSDVVLASGTACTPDSDLCTLDACDAAGACAHTATADTDGDGTCDAIDPCTNVGGGQAFLTAPKSKTVLSKVNTDTVPGNDGFTLKAAFDLGSGDQFSDLHPDANGARIVVTGASSAPIVDVTLVPGPYGGKGSRGWSRATSGKTWTFQDTTGSPADGILKLKISDKTTSKTPSRASVVLTGKKGSYPALAADLPLAVTVTLGNQADASAGLCGESAYTAADCKLNHAGNQMSCAR